MILAIGNRIKNAARVKLWNGTSFYLVIGGLTPWSPSDSSPPSPSTLTTSIPDAFAVVPATVNWLKQDDLGTIAILGADNSVETYSELLTEADLISWGNAGNPFYVLFSATLVDSDIDPSITAYRQLGFASDLTFNGGYSYSSAYIPAANVTSWGQLETLEYRRPYPVIVGSEHIFYEVVQY